ncbi:protein phosphatase 2C domain-containing protein [Streptomyces samsunensis]|nr:protein phosphatase 2C domain-containing protein [Streptomyces samsunensis]
MSQQGDRRRHEDDWWGELYDPRRADAGPASASDSVDDRFDSASRTLAGGEDAGNQRPAAGAPWGPRTGESGGGAPGSGADAEGGPQGWRSPAGEGPGAALPSQGGTGADAAEGGTGGSGAAQGGITGSGATPPSRRQRDNAGSGSAEGRAGGGAAQRGAGSGGSGDAPGPAGSWDAPGRSGPGNAPGRLGPENAPRRTGPESPPERTDPRSTPGRTGPKGAPRRSDSGGAPGRTGADGSPGRAGPGDAPSRVGGSAVPSSSPSRNAGSPVPPRFAGGVGPDPSRPWRAVAASYVGDEPPTYEAEPTTLPVADPEDLRDLVPDTVLEGARYGTLTLRAASLRGDAARYRGEPRRDALLAVRFGTGDSALILIAVATGQRAVPGAHRVARELCEWIAGAVGSNQQRLTEDIHTANRGALSSGLNRLTGRAYGRLRAGATVRGLAPADHTASLRCLLLPAHPACRTRVFFGVGDGGLFRLRDGVWQDLEPEGGERDTVGGPVLGYGGRPPVQRPSHDPNPSREPNPDPAPAHGPFRFRASVARPGDTLLLCSAGLADPLRGEAALAGRLAERWGTAEPPGLAAFLTDAQTGVKGYSDDRTAAAVWEA